MMMEGGDADGLERRRFSLSGGPDGCVDCEWAGQCGSLLFSTAGTHIASLFFTCYFDCVKLRMYTPPCKLPASISIWSM